MTTLDKNEPFGEVYENWIFLLDTSMNDKGMEQLNSTMEKSIKKLTDIAKTSRSGIIIRAIKFDSSASYVIGGYEKGINLKNEDVKWENLKSGRGANLSLGIEECLKSLRIEYIGKKSYQPVVVLISDGKFDCEEASSAIEKLQSRVKCSPFPREIIRISVGVDGYNKENLEKFASQKRHIYDQADYVFDVKDENYIEYVRSDLEYVYIEPICIDDVECKAETLVDTPIKIDFTFTPDDWGEF